MTSRFSRHRSTNSGPGSASDSPVDGCERVIRVRPATGGGRRPAAAPGCARRVAPRSRGRGPPPTLRLCGRCARRSVSNRDSSTRRRRARSCRDRAWLMIAHGEPTASTRSHRRYGAESDMASSGQRRRVRTGEVVAVIGGALLLVASWGAVAVASHVPHREARLFRAVNDLPDFLWRALWAPMQLGSFVGSLVVVAITAVVSRSARLTLAALVASQLAFWLAKMIKTTVSRGRPEALLANVHLREHAHGLGYVSGHSAVAFALAAVLVPSLPRRWQPVAWLVAVMVAIRGSTQASICRSTWSAEPASGCCSARSAVGRSASVARVCRWRAARSACPRSGSDARARGS